MSFDTFTLQYTRVLTHHTHQRTHTHEHMNMNLIWRPSPRQMFHRHSGTNIGHSTVLHLAWSTRVGFTHLDRVPHFTHHSHTSAESPRTFTYRTDHTVDQAQEASRPHTTVWLRRSHINNRLDRPTSFLFVERTQVKSAAPMVLNSSYLRSSVVGVVVVTLSR